MTDIRRNVLLLLLTALALSGRTTACVQCTTTWEQGIALSAEIDKPAIGTKVCPGGLVEYSHKNLVGDDLKITDCEGDITVEHVGECETIQWTVDDGLLIPAGPGNPTPKWQLPCTPGTYTITLRVTDHQCAGQDGWYDDDDVVLQRSVMVVEPKHDAFWLQPPSGGPVGGAFKGVIETDTMCGDLTTNWQLKIRKAGSEDPWINAGVVAYCYRSEPPGCCDEPLVEPDVTTCQYLVAGFTITSPQPPWDLDPHPSVPLNGSYDSRLTFTYTPPPGCGTPVEQHLDEQINIQNLCVSAVTPDDHVQWDGTSVSSPINVSLEDDDFDDPMDIILTLYSCADGVFYQMGEPIWSWSPIRTMQLTGVTGAAHPVHVGRQGR
jgi:hypothetical protein